MGFLDGSSIGFGDISVGGGSSSGSSQNPSVIFKETSTTLLTSEKCVGSKNASSNIEYVLPTKGELLNGDMFEIINLNSNYSITIKDNEHNNIEGSNSFVIDAESNISVILDKDNNLWKLVNGI